MKFLHHKKITTKDRIDFTQQLLLLLQAGIPLADALSLISKSVPNLALQKIIISVREKITTGINFSSALKNFPYVFNDEYCHMILAGEKSGECEIVLALLIETEEKKLQLKNKIIKALFYPISILCAAVAITAGMLIFVIPQFRTLYKNFGAQLPALTRTLVHLSQLLLRHGFLFLLSTVMISLIIFLCFKKFTIKNKIEQWLFYFPPYRHLMITKQVAHWSRLLSMTLHAHIPLIDALQISERTITYLIFKQDLQKVRQAVLRGKALHTALKLCRYFPKRAQYLIAIGENADALDVMTEKIANIYQQQLDTQLDHLSKLLEPVIMIIVASMVSGLIIALYLPIFKMGNVI